MMVRLMGAYGNYREVIKCKFLAGQGPIKGFRNHVCEIRVP